MHRNHRLILFSLLFPVLLFKCTHRLPLNNSRQLVVVVTPDWKASHGTLYRFERSESESAWQTVSAPIPVILGRNGMGWGRGLHPSGWRRGPQKREGDGRSPAGVFGLGEAFGFPASDTLSGLKIPYRPIDEFLACIDDVDSRYYAQLIERDVVNDIDWQSSEVIIESPRAYYLGIVVEYNTTRTVKGQGSCIFLHCWTAPEDSTAGCTTFNRPEMEKVGRWLDASANPVIIQLPLPVYRRLLNRWHLPALAQLSDG